MANIKMKNLITELSNEDYPDELDVYIGKKMNDKTIDGWSAEYDSRDQAIYWHSDRKAEDSWTITTTVADELPPQFVFKVEDENDVFFTKKYKYKPSNFEKDFKLYMKYLKNLIKVYNKKMKLA